jgi:hypothetical protein
MTEALALSFAFGFFAGIGVVCLAVVRVLERARGLPRNRNFFKVGILSEPGNDR